MANEKLGILKLLIENREKEFSIRQIAKMRGINYKSAYQNIAALRGEGAVTVKELGNISLCSFSGGFSDSVFLVERERTAEALKKNRDLKSIQHRLNSINGQFILLLFGSHMKGTATKQSDIDLLLITGQPDEIQNELDLLPLKIHVTHVPYKDFASMLRSREPTVVSEAVKKNIILFGAEDYYRMTGNAG
jgi:predicted nucleotidyltransferase